MAANVAPARGDGGFSIRGKHRPDGAALLPEEQPEADVAGHGLDLEEPAPGVVVLLLPLPGEVAWPDTLVRPTPSVGDVGFEPEEQLRPVGDTSSGQVTRLRPDVREEDLGLAVLLAGVVGLLGLGGVVNTSVAPALAADGRSSASGCAATSASGWVANEGSPGQRHLSICAFRSSSAVEPGRTRSASARTCFAITGMPSFHNALASNSHPLVWNGSSCVACCASFQHFCQSFRPA
mmetsp:Transcript_94281/g.272483  ORF Transcript_94281/g.272483 Transcript_94281/m.272483 type:complete len:236 (-) Transcript_94281:366-1073(-)